jgi:uncharacterized membrane protein affecting hemolysin expression
MKKLPTSLTPLDSKITEEYLRQVKWSFNLAFTATIISFAIGVVGAGLLLSGRITEGAAATSAGFASSWGCQQLARKANQRLR